MKPKRFYSRKWLNKAKHHTSAHLIMDVRCDIDKYGKPLKEHRSVNTSFEIMDCNRKVSLDFYMHGDKSDKAANGNALAKAYLLRDSMDEFIEALEIAKEWVEEDA